ncbi:MAG: 4-hydroxy-3-methylbut-2-enyl diphosphate reductase [Myxococcales bacterium]|nr:4-hydroxy-3-methylbut-2-enyl diphosphate reductase [Myxococcales bacterium]
MKFILAQSAGFCFGVRRAVDLVLAESAAQHGGITTYGPLVHNPQVIELLTLREVNCVDNLDLIREGMAVIRTHGVPPEAVDDLRGRGLEILDATCPKVRAVQKVIEKHATEGRTIVIFGEREHPEVVGLVGAARGRPCHVVLDPEQFDALGLPPETPLTLVAQTTANRQRFLAFVAHAQARHPQCDVRHTICDATETRQAEVRELAKQVQAMIVVGGRNSGNTRRLAAISQDLGLPTWHVETADELDGLDFSAYDKVGVTAGASTPSWIIDRVMNRLNEMEEEKSRPLLAWSRRLIESLTSMHFTTGLAAGSLAYVGAVLMGLDFRLDFFLLVGCYVLAMHVLNRFAETGVDKFRDDPKRQVFYRRHSSGLWTLGIGAGLLSILLGFQLGVIPFIFVLIASIIGVLYSVRVVPKSWMGFLGFRRLKDIAASKNFFVASAWALVSIFPLFFVTATHDWGRLILSFFFLFVVTGIRSVLLDLSDMTSDRLVGRETIPLALGPDRTRRLVTVVVTGLTLGLFATAGLGWLPGLAWLLGFWTLFELLYFRYFYRSRKLPTLTRDLWVDLHFIAAGLLALGWRLLNA